jgi:hypothetical protein
MIMRALLTILIVQLLLPATAPAAGPESAEYARLSKVLFPETRTWQVVDSLPTPDAAKLQQERWLLRRIYLLTPQTILMENPYCSVITRVLYERFAPGSFRRADVDGDGQEDLMYSGDAECSEGYAAIIWFGGSGGLAERSVGIIPFLVLGLERDGARRMSSVEVGCCADPVDEYLVGDLKDPRGLARLRVPKALVLPEGMKLSSKAFAARGKLVLFVDPTSNDASNATPRAIVGDRGAGDLHGVKGRLVATFTDSHGKEWGLVAVDEASRALLAENFDSVDVGWVRIK